MRCTASPTSASKTWPPIRWSTPRFGSRPSCTSTRGCRFDDDRRRGAGRFRRRREGLRRRGPSDRGALLVTAMRHAAVSREIAELAIRFRDKGVVGFDIAGAEAGNPPDAAPGRLRVHARPQRALHHSCRRGVRAAVHPRGDRVLRCGPAGSRGAHRRRHRSAATTAGPAGRLASILRDKRIPLELCPSSNVQTGAVKSIAEHPFDLLARAAVPGDRQHRQPADERHLR